MTKQLKSLLGHLNKNDLQAELYRRSFYKFSLDAFKELHNGEELINNWHIEYLCQRLQQKAELILSGKPRDKHLIINVPPRTLKSELVNVFFSVYLWIIKDSIQFISTSYSASLSMTMNVQARRLVESDWFKAHFNNIKISKDENTKGKFTTTAGGLRYSTSTGGTITGMGGDVIVIDDPQNPQLARSKTERDNANIFFNETLRSRLNNPSKGIFIVIMQRLHEEDLTGMLLKLDPENWDHICLPAESSDNIKPIELIENYTDGLLFPDRLSKYTLNQFRLGLGSYGYSGQYEQLPSPQDGGILKSKWFNLVNNIKDEEGNIVDLNELNWDFFLDTAYTTKQTNDPSAMLSCTYYNNNIYIRNITTVRLEFPELIREIKDFVSNNGYTRRSMIYIEPKASGKSVVQQLHSTEGLNIMESNPPENDKISRVNSVAPVIESGRVHLLEGRYIDPFLSECNSFPNGIHDDMVDTLVMAIDELTQDNNIDFF